MKSANRIPTGRGYPAHIGLSLKGANEWMLSCDVCLQSVLCRNQHGRSQSARFLNWHKHCGLLKPQGGRVNG